MPKKTDSFTAFVPFSKVEEQPDGTVMIYGRATQEVGDSQGEIMDYESSAPQFKRRAEERSRQTNGENLMSLRAMHQPVAAGKVTQFDFVPEEKAIDIWSHVVDQNEVNKVLKNVYTGFSVGGRYLRRWPDPSGLMRFTADPHEISLVDEPSVPTARFTMFKIDDPDDLMAAAKEEDMTPAPETVGEMESAPQISPELKMDGDVSAAPVMDTAETMTAVEKTGAEELEGWHKGDEKTAPEKAPVEFERLADLSAANQEFLKVIGDRVGIAPRTGSPSTPPQGYPKTLVDYGDPANFSFPVDSLNWQKSVERFNKGDLGMYSSRERHILGRRITQSVNRFGAFSYDPILQKISRKEKTMSQQTVDVGKLIANIKSAGEKGLAEGGDSSLAKDALTQIVGMLDDLSTPIGGAVPAPANPSTPVVAKGEAVPEAQETHEEPDGDEAKSKKDEMAEKIASIEASVRTLIEGMQKMAEAKPAPMSKGEDQGPLNGLNSIINLEPVGDPALNNEIIKALDEGGPYAMQKALKAAGVDDEYGGGALALQRVYTAIREATYATLERGGVVTKSRHQIKLLGPEGSPFS